MNNENQQNQTHKSNPSLGRRTIDELLTLKEEIAGRFEEIIERIEQNYDRRLENAILFLAGSDDGENLESSIGFNGSDSRFGHSLARHLQSGAMLTLKQAQAALQMMQKYSQTQLEPNGYALPMAWEEISHQYRERKIEGDPSPTRLVLQRDEEHGTYIGVFYTGDTELREHLSGCAGDEDNLWSDPSDNWDYCYSLRTTEALLAEAAAWIERGFDWYVDPDIEAAYYLWQEEQKAGIGSGRISASFSRSATSSESSSNDTVDPMGDTPLEMVYVPQGEFLMGSPETELKRRETEGPQHRVTVPAFYMGKYPVTQRQWRVVALLDPVDIPLEPRPSRFKGDDRPVEKVTWFEAVEFCKRLSKHTGDYYRLPSEAEWEYACRATQDSTSTPFYFGETLSTEQANYDAQHNKYNTYGQDEEGVSREKTTKIGSFPANAFGLHDMHGNVYEWCKDVWHDSYEGAPTHGSAWVTDGTYGLEYRTSRGGSWDVGPEHCRSANRSRGESGGYRYDSQGLRVVCSSPKALLSEVEETQKLLSRSETASEASSNDTVDPTGDVPLESATSSESSSNNTVDPTGDIPLEMAPNVLRPGDYSGVWHGHAVRFSIQQIFPTGQFNGVGEFVGGPHNGIRFGFTGKTDSDGRLTISRDVGIGSQVASDANFEIDGDSIVWQGLTQGPGIGDAGLPFEFRAQPINSGRIDHGPSKVEGDDLPVEKARMPLLYQVENQWGGNNAPWHNGGTWVMGCRHNQNIIAINIKSDDGGKTFHGNMAYANEGPIGFRATLFDGNSYAVENQWGGDDAPWHDGGQ